MPAGRVHARGTGPSAPPSRADRRSGHQGIRAAAGRRDAGPIAPADAPCRRPRAAAAARRRCRPGSSTARRGRAAAGWRAGRRRPRSRCVAKLWRSACGVAVAGSPSACRAVRIAFCSTVGDSGPPRAPRNSGSSGSVAERAERAVALDGGAGGGQDGHLALLAALAGDAQHVRQRRVALAQGQRLGDAQAGAPEQRQRGDVAGGDPGLARDGPSPRSGGGRRGRRPGAAGGRTASGCAGCGSAAQEMPCARSSQA